MSENPSQTPDTITEAHALILFDGVCNLCNGAVQWIIRRDRKAIFRFAALQSLAAQRAIEATGAGAGVEATSSGTEFRPDSIIVIETGRILLRSDAAMAIAGRLGLPWSLARAGRVLPVGMRDGIYRWIARNRYRWFGKRETCMVPTPELRARFLYAGLDVGEERQANDVQRESSRSMGRAGQ